MNTTTSPPTPETDAATFKILSSLQSGTEKVVHAEICAKLERERDEARDQLERWQMRLAACDVVAMSDTESSRGPARDMHKDYWSAAVESVIRRVDECIELRKQLEDMREAIKEVFNSFADEPASDSAWLLDDRQTAALAKLQPFIKP